MNAVSEIEPTAGTTGATPGALLRDERERRGLTVQQVSEELHLDTWLIDALEENRFLALGAPVYAKGHLRKYAVLLGVSPELILARYQAIATPAPLPPPPVEALIAPPAERGVDLRRMDWRLYALIGGLVVSATGIGWLVAQPKGSAPTGTQLAAPSGKPNVDPAPARVAAAPAQPVAPPVTNPPASEATPAPVPKASAPVRPPPTPGDPPAMAAGRPQTVGTSKVQAPITAVSPAETRATPAPTGNVPPQLARAAPQPQPQTLATKPPVGSTPPVQQPAAAVQLQPVRPERPAPAVQAAKTVTAPPAAAATPEPTPQPEAGPQVSLRLEFTMASWAEVYDGDGRRLMYAIGDPNKPRSISGKAPLKVTLGTAGSVQARVNGRPIAIPRRIGQESATFSINANGSIRLR